MTLYFNKSHHLYMTPYCLQLLVHYLGLYWCQQMIQCCLSNQQQISILILRMRYRLCLCLLSKHLSFMCEDVSIFILVSLF
jgi:hypothetical protein